jgi:hypothetical protein
MIRAATRDDVRSTRRHGLARAEISGLTVLEFVAGLGPFGSHMHGLFG